MTEGEMLYKTEENKEIAIQLQGQDIWLDTRSIADLFGVKRPAIVKHVRNIYNSEELQEDSTCSILEQVAKDGKKRKINHYNLDVIISVGYRVNSVKGTKFRIWVTKAIKNKLEVDVKQQSRQLQDGLKYKEMLKIIDIADIAMDDRNDLNITEAKGIIKLIKDYALALDTLDQYDHHSLLVKGTKDSHLKKIDYKLAKRLIAEWKDQHDSTPFCCIF